jgi:hypothetical protein
MKMSILLAMFLDVVAFNSTGRVSAYFLLEPDSCPNLHDAIGMQRRLFAEIVQTKEDRMNPACKCQVVESISSVLWALVCCSTLPKGKALGSQHFTSGL